MYSSPISSTYSIVHVYGNMWHIISARTLQTWQLFLYGYARPRGTVNEQFLVNKHGNPFLSHIAIILLLHK